MISAIFIFSDKGEVLISRIYKPNIKRSCSDLFRIHVVSATEVRSPVIRVGELTFFHIKHDNIYVVAVTTANPNACLVFEFLGKIAKLGESYFKKFNEEAVKNNFTLIYELLDEICDFGYPQNTEAETLKLFITTEGIQSERALDEGAKIAIQATGSVSWRRPDIKYRKNEAFVDIIESINLIMSPKGTILQCDVSGQIMMRSYLSGMPECKIGINDKLLYENKTQNAGSRQPSKTVELDDCQFHQCVKLGKFDANRTITFIPPDGEFELMRYRTTDNITLPFKVHAVVNELTSNRVEFRIAIRSTFNTQHIFAQKVSIHVPTPPNTVSASIGVSGGKAKYNGSENSLVWKMHRFPANGEFLMTAEATLASTTVKKQWSRPPITVDFQVLMFTGSGLQVRFLKIFEKSNYPTVKWVRYMTKAGSYQIRF